MKISSIQNPILKKAEVVVNKLIMVKVPQLDFSFVYITFKDANSGSRSKCLCCSRNVFSSLFLSWRA